MSVIDGFTARQRLKNATKILQEIYWDCEKKK